MKMKWILGALVLGATAALATVSVDFSYDTVTYPSRLNGPQSPLTLVFTVDGSGNVSLDASALDSDTDIQAIVNSWDGPVGTVGDAGLWGTSFTLQATAYSVTNGMRDFRLEPDQTGGMGVVGSNSGRIDGMGPDKDPEHVEVVLTDGSVALNFGEIMYVGGATGSDFYVADGTTSNNNYNVGASGTRSISGLSLTTGVTLSIAQPADTDKYDNGIALGGLTFTVTSIGGGTPVNLIQNGSFETGYSTDWVVASPSEAVVVSNTASDGSYALQLDSSDGAVGDTGQTVPVQSNTGYVFTHAVYYPAGSTGTVTARLMFDGRALRISTASSTAGWVIKEARFNSGSATEIELDIYADDAFAEPVYLDNLRLEQLVKPFRYETWAGINGIGAADADADEDGLNNLYEFAFAGNPTNSADTGSELTVAVVSNALVLSNLERNDDIYLQSITEVCTNLVSGTWTPVDSAPVTTGMTGQYDVVVNTIPLDTPQAYFRTRVETRTETYANDGYYEIVPTGTSDDTALIQNALDQLQAGDALKLTGDFAITDTIYLPSNFRWILDGSLSLADNADDNLDDVGWYEELGDARTNIIDATRRTGITETPGGAGNIEMSGGTYYGNSAGNPASLRLINFVSVTNSTFHDMVITDASDDNFTLGPGCNNNVCRNLIGTFAGGNALTDKGDHNKWYDCVASDCASDGWTPKCRYSEFYRCIAARNEGPGFGMYCRIDGSGKPDDLGEAIDGNKFYACASYGNNAAGFSFNISSTSGEGGTIRSNYVEAVCYSNASSGVRFRNKMPNSIVADNEINLLCYGNRGEKKSGPLSSLAGGLGTDASFAYPVTGITGSMVSFDNIQWDVNTGAAYDSDITVYRPVGDSAPLIKSGDSSNVITVETFDCSDPLVEWCMQAYCDLISP